MTGISCPPSDNPFHNKEKELKKIKILKLRFSIILLLSHELVFFIRTPDVKVKKTAVNKFVPPKNFKALKVPLSINFPLKKSGQIASLLTKNNKIVANKVYIEKKHSSESNLYVIYVTDRDANRLITSNTDIFQAYPANLVNQNIKREKKSYEIIF